MGKKHLVRSKYETRERLYTSDSFSDDYRLSPERNDLKAKPREDCSRGQFCCSRETCSPQRKYDKNDYSMVNLMNDRRYRDQKYWSFSSSSSSSSCSTCSCDSCFSSSNTKTDVYNDSCNSPLESTKASFFKASKSYKVIPKKKKKKEILKSYEKRERETSPRKQRYESTKDSEFTEFKRGRETRTQRQQNLQKDRLRKRGGSYAGDLRQRRTLDSINNTREIRKTSKRANSFNGNCFIYIICISI